MKNRVVLFIITFLIISCKKDKSEHVFYKAVNGENIGLLSLTIGENYFFGQYELRYGRLGKDIGEVRGTIFGDTLKGKFRYLSYGGGNKIAPFVLLKHNKGLKLGSGTISTFMNIPFYIPETLEFKDTDFQFYRIDEKSAKKLGFIFK
ncbi:hypothetical protein [Flavobacterium marginilacus]|uniref:hypothetical protein n=1 Tax=Flavobacterium marginilacus TaxID=3003256 RepID=UPI00248DCF78|nr:hypothetical protein [Flavobacterium marginilacus]